MSQEHKGNRIEVTIVVEDVDYTQHEMAEIASKVARVMNLLAANVMRAAAFAPAEKRAAGAGHPVCQSMLACAAQADAVAINLAGPGPQLVTAGPPPPRRPM